MFSRSFRIDRSNKSFSDLPSLPSCSTKKLKAGASISINESRVGSMNQLDGIPLTRPESIMLTFTVELDGGMLRAGGETGVGSDAILADVPVETGERLTKMEV